MDSVTSETSVTSSESDTLSNFIAITETNKRPVVERAVGADSLRQLREDDDFWYVDKKPDAPKPRQKPKTNFLGWLFQQGWFWIALAAIFVGLLIWYLASLDIRLFRKPPRVIAESDGEPSLKDLFTINYKEELKKALSEGNYRLAVRLLYLQLLKEMAQRDVVKYKPELTNAQYVTQLYGTAYYKDFFHITRYFDYSWYGQFPVDEKTYVQIKAEMDNLKNRLPA